MRKDAYSSPTAPPAHVQQSLVAQGVVRQGQRSGLIPSWLHRCALNRDAFQKCILVHDFLGSASYFYCLFFRQRPAEGHFLRLSPVLQDEDVPERFQVVFKNNHRYAQKGPDHTKNQILINLQSESNTFNKRFAN